jgi:hypothetical protein
MMGSQSLNSYMNSGSAMMCNFRPHLHGVLQNQLVVSLLSQQDKEIISGGYFNKYGSQDQQTIVAAHIEHVK